MVSDVITLFYTGAQSMVSDIISMCISQGPGGQSMVSDTAVYGNIDLFYTGGQSMVPDITLYYTGGQSMVPDHCPVSDSSLSG